MMKMGTNKLTLLLLFLTGHIIVVFGQYQPDSLHHYMEIAVRNNPVVLQKYYEYQAALQKIPQVGSLPDPELSMGVFLSPMELISGKQVADIRIMQMFPWFGVLKNAKDEMSLMAKAKYEAMQDAKLQVLLDVQRTYYELQKNQQKILITEKNIEILQTIKRLSVTKFSTVSTGGSTSASGINSSINSIQPSGSGSQGMNSMGGSSNNSQSVNNVQSAMAGNQSSMNSQGTGLGLTDIYQIDIEKGNLENNIALMKNQQSTLIASFNSYLNRMPASLVSLPDSIKPDTLDIMPSLSADSIIINNPMLNMLQFEQQSYDARKRMVSAMGYPMVGLGVNYSVINKDAMSTSDMNGKDMIMPMVTVTVPLYRKKYKAMQAEADLLKASSLAGYQASFNSLRVEYFQALQQFEDAQLRMDLYQRQSELTQKSLDLMINSFSVSNSGLTDVLRNQQQLLDYKTKTVEAITDFNTAIAWLKRLAASTEFLTDQKNSL